MKSRISSKNIDIEMEIDHSLNVRVEKVSFINSVINNILSNAIKFSFPGSRIFISAANRKKQNGTGNFKKEIQLSFRDQGIGIPKDDQKKIFMLSKTKSRTGTEGETGFGYGMPLINRFIGLYHGRIEIESIEKVQNSTDHGTTITLVLHPG
jgi:signal transduction histidine kinase